jgi:DNA-binding transcriptional ArsR family regulator
MSPRAAGRPRGGGRGEDRSGIGAAASVFAALGDETRLDLVDRLCTGGPMSIARLTEGTAVTRQAVAKHLRVLADAGLAHGTRVGRDHVWEIDASRLDETRRWLDRIQAHWDAALARLKASLERS